MSFLEFFILAIYLSFLLSVIVVIQVLNPGKAIREAQKVEVVEEPFLDSEDEKPEFNPETEEYEMTENPMLRHRKIEQKELSAMEQVD